MLHPGKDCLCSICCQSQRPSSSTTLCIQKCVQEWMTFCGSKQPRNVYGVNCVNMRRRDGRQQHKTRTKTHTPCNHHDSQIAKKNRSKQEALALGRYLASYRHLLDDVPHLSLDRSRPRNKHSYYDIKEYNNKCPVDVRKHVLGSEN